MIDGEQLFNTLLRDYEANGVSAIDRLAKENPLVFLQIIAAMVCDIHGEDGDEKNETQRGR